MDLSPKWLLQKWPPRLHQPGPPRLWKIGYALIACFAAALGGLVALWLIALTLLSHPKLPHSKVISLHDTVGVAQLVFASVAGAGALVALVMAYRRQRVAEAATVLDKERWQVTAAHDRTRLLNERFTAIAAQLGDDQAAVRLAGVHAMAGLADDWAENRQTCVDVLCAYLRMPYEPGPGPDAPAAKRLAFQGSREVRHTVIRVIAAHLRGDAGVSWQGLKFDFAGVVFDGGDFTGAVFSGGRVSFYGAEFSAGDINFAGAVFSGGKVNFYGARFSGGQVNFAGARFSGGQVHFDGAEFSRGDVIFATAGFSGGEVRFAEAVFSGCEVSFANAKFSSGKVTFARAKFSGGEVSFGGAEFSGSKVYVGGAVFSGGKVSFSAVFSGGEVTFFHATFSGGEVSFGGAVFSGSEVDFSVARFSGGRVGFGAARFYRGQVSFVEAVFSGGEVDFTDPLDWSHPPTFDWDTPPPGVRVPATHND